MAFHSAECVAQLASYCRYSNCEIKWPGVKTGGAGRIKLTFCASRVPCILRKSFAEGGQWDFSLLSFSFPYVFCSFLLPLHWHAFNSDRELLNWRTESQTYWSSFKNEFISRSGLLIPHPFLFPSLALMEWELSGFFRAVWLSGIFCEKENCSYFVQSVSLWISEHQSILQGLKK